MRGPAAGTSLASVTAREKLCCMMSDSTSWRTCSPNCWRMTLIGALPGRKPLSFAVRLTRFRRSAMACSISSFGTLTSIRRSRLPVDCTLTCIGVIDPQEGLACARAVRPEKPRILPRKQGLGSQRRPVSVVRKEGLEPSRGYPLEPKSSASTSSATFAGRAARAPAAIPRPRHVRPRDQWRKGGSRTCERRYAADPAGSRAPWRPPGSAPGPAAPTLMTRLKSSAPTTRAAASGPEAIPIFDAKPPSAADWPVWSNCAHMPSRYGMPNDQVTPISPFASA